MATQSSRGPGQDCLDSHRFWRLESWKNKKWNTWDIWSASNDFQFFIMCSLEQTHIHDLQFPFVLSKKLFFCWKSPPVYPSPERPDPGEHGDEAIDQQHPGLVHTRAVGGQHHDPRDEHDQPGGQMFHTKWLTWVVVRTNTDKTSKGSPCDEEGSPCQSLPLGNSGSCQVLQPLGIATTHLVWNIFYTISRNCKKHLSVVFKNDFSKLLNPIFWNILQEIFIIEMGWQSD